MYPQSEEEYNEMMSGQAQAEMEASQYQAAAQFELENTDFERVIKFRAWSPTLKKMLDDKQSKLTLLNQIECGVQLDCIVMQFTGIINNQGQEIYEGDIIETPFGIKNKVFWYNHRWCYGNQFNKDGTPITWIEFNARNDKENKVIGNIFQHPDLLK